MKKLVSMYQKYMFRPILYKSVTRVSVVAVLMLLWDRYVSDGTFTMWQTPALLLGVVLLAWAWVNYLRLDGVTIHHLGEEFKDMGKKKKFHSTKSIVDFADERIVSFEELEPEERTYCSMLSNLILGGALLIIGSLQAQCEGGGHGRKRRKTAGGGHSCPCGLRQDHPLRGNALPRGQHPQAGPGG